MERRRHRHDRRRLVQAGRPVRSRDAVRPANRLSADEDGDGGSRPPRDSVRASDETWQKTAVKPSLFAAAAGALLVVCAADSTNHAWSAAQTADEPVDR